MSVFPLRAPAVTRLAIGAALMLIPLGTHTRPAAADAPQNGLITEAHGKCPKPYNDSAPEPCWDEFLGNARTRGWFKRPGEWGVAYAFNCTGDRHRFHFSIAVYAHYLDNSGFILRRTKGSGVYMETGNDDKNPMGTDSPDFPQQEYGVIDSTCRWIVRVVDGSKDVVTQFLPEIPKRG